MSLSLEPQPGARQKKKGSSGLPYRTLRESTTPYHHGRSALELPRTGELPRILQRQHPDAQPRWVTKVIPLGTRAPEFRPNTCVRGGYLSARMLAVRQLLLYVLLYHTAPCTLWIVSPLRSCLRSLPRPHEGEDGGDGRPDGLVAAENIQCTTRAVHRPHRLTGEDGAEREA
jgi:hypothetical protein